MTWSLVAFGILAGIIVLGAYKVVATPLITHAALYLVMVLVGVAGIYVLLEAPFLAAVQVLVYAGAVMAVIVFAIMLSELRELGAPEGPKGGIGHELRTALQSRYWGVLPAAIAGLVGVLVLVNISRFGAETAPAVADTSVSGLGRLLFTTYLVPFEIASAVMLVAMVGAIYLAGAGDPGNGGDAK